MTTQTKKVAVKAANGLDWEAFTGVVVFTAIGILLNEVMSRNVAIGLSDVDGCSRWSWYLGFSIQGLVYPFIFLMAFVNGECGGDPQKLLVWFNSSWADRRSSFYEKCWFCAFFAYLVRDMLIMDDTLFLIHHVVCMGGVLFALYVPRGTVPLLAGMFLLELGSFCMASSKIMPGILSDGQFEPHSDLRWDRLYWVGMTVSNILCMGCAFYSIFVSFDLQHSGLERVFKVFFTLLTAGLCYLRQLWSNDNMFTAEERYNEMQSHEKINHDDKLISNEAAACLVGLFGALWALGLLAVFYFSYRVQGYRLYPLQQGQKKAKAV